MEIFLDAFSKTHPEHPPGTHGKKRLHYLITGAQRVGKRVHEADDPLEPIPSGVRKNQKIGGDTARAKGTEKISPFCPCKEHHGHGDAENDHSRGHVGLKHDESAKSQCDQ